MAVAIRLTRRGTKKRPYYHIIVADSRNARDSGNILDTVGKYDPMQPKDSGKRVTLLEDKIKDWMAKGARPSDRVYKFLANAGMVAKKAIPVQTKQHLQSEKTLMRIKDKQEKLAKIAEEKAAAEAAAQPEPVVEEVVEEVAPEIAAEESAPVVEETPAVEEPAPEVAPEVAAEEPAPEVAEEAPAEAPAEEVAVAPAE